MIIFRSVKYIYGKDSHYNKASDVAYILVMIFCHIDDPFVSLYTIICDLTSNNSKTVSEISKGD